MRTMYLAACLIAAAAAPANAEDVSQRIAALSVSGSQIVNGKADTDLQSRVAYAVDLVCGTTADSLEQYADLARCRKAARAAVAEQIAKHSQSQMLAARK